MPDKSLLESAHRLAKEVVQSVRRREDVHPVIEECQDAVYLKDHEGQIAASNMAYARLFHDGRPLVGRDPQRYLDAVTLEVERASDALLAAGVEEVSFVFAAGEQPSVADAGQPNRFRVVKLTLRDYGTPNLACLGVVRSVGTFRARPPTGLHHAWTKFSKLPLRARDCGLLLAQGHSRGEVARRLHLSTRTVDIDRKLVLDALELENTHQLTRLLGRVQDAAYADLGM